MAWFNLLSTLIRRGHSLLSEKANKVVPSIVNALEETEPVVGGAVWECLAVYVKANAEVSAILFYSIFHSNEFSFRNSGKTAIYEKLLCRN